jgi:hypothetical protein
MLAWPNREQSALRGAHLALPGTTAPVSDPHHPRSRSLIAPILLFDFYKRETDPIVGATT